jgi:hypothetical protein
MLNELENIAVFLSVLVIAIGIGCGVYVYFNYNNTSNENPVATEEPITVDTTLIKCPKCGSEATLNYNDTIGDLYYPVEGCAQAGVRCSNEACGIGTELYVCITPEEAVVQAIKAWNNQIGILE